MSRDKHSHLVNRIKCNECGDVITSKHQHDFVRCSCGAVAVDGGPEYQRVLGEWDDWENLAEVKKASDIDDNPIGQLEI